MQDVYEIWNLKLAKIFELRISAQLETRASRDVSMFCQKNWFVYYLMRIGKYRHMAIPTSDPESISYYIKMCIAHYECDTVAWAKWKKTLPETQQTQALDP